MELILLMKQIYQQRDLHRIDELMELMFDETKTNIIVGTGFGEICITKEERRLIFENDLKYWGDLLIDIESFKSLFISNLEFITVKATSYSKPAQNTHQYHEYARNVEEILKNEILTPYQKATEIDWYLSCVLVPDDLTLPIEEKPIEINMILENKKVRFMNFSYVKTLDQADSIYNWTEIRTRYEKFSDMTQFSNNTELIDSLTKEEGLNNVNIKMVNDRIFFGIGLVDIEKTIDERLTEYLSQIRKISDLQFLFDARRNIASILMLYANKEKLQAVVRFFGICDQSGIQIIKYFYPNY